MKETQTEQRAERGKVKCEEGGLKMSRGQKEGRLLSVLFFDFQKEQQSNCSLLCAAEWSAGIFTG